MSETRAGSPTRCARRRDTNLAQLDELIAARNRILARFLRALFSRLSRASVSETREKEGLLRFRSLCEKHGIFCRRTTHAPRLAPGLAAEQLRIGISGWTYAGWRGVFYPKRSRAQIASCISPAATFNSIEINGSFYSLQRPCSYQKWYDETPRGFYLQRERRALHHAHEKTARCRGAAGQFLRLRRARACAKNSGRFSGNFRRTSAGTKSAFANFSSSRRRDTARSRASSRKLHDDKLKHGAWTKTDANRRLRYAVEIRHPTFLVPEFFALLREYNIAFVFADTAGKWPYVEELTADFVYIRLHGSEQLYVSGYSDSRTRLVGAIAFASGWRNATRAIYVYFDNDAKVHAPFDAKKLADARCANRVARWKDVWLIAETGTDAGPNDGAIPWAELCGLPCVASLLQRKNFSCAG